MTRDDRTLVSVLPLLFLLGCGGGSQDESIHAEEASSAGHDDAAEREEAHAEEEEGRYDPSADQPVGMTRPELYGVSTYNPTAVHLQHAAEHRDHAEQHRASAEAHGRFDQEHCARFPAESRATCPLIGQVAGAAEVSQGSRLELTEGVNRAAFVDHVRCHLEFAASEAHPTADHCPLFIPGVQVELTESDVVLTAPSEQARERLRSLIREHVLAADET